MKPDFLRHQLCSQRREWGALGRWKGSCLEQSQALRKDTAVDRCPCTENPETMAPLSSVLYANPHASIRYSLKRGEDISVRPTGFKHPLCFQHFVPNKRGSRVTLLLLRISTSRNISANIYRTWCRYRRTVWGFSESGVPLNRVKHASRLFSRRAEMTCTLLPKSRIGLDLSVGDLPFTHDPAPTDASW